MVKIRSRRKNILSLSGHTCFSKKMLRYWHQSKTLPNETCEHQNPAVDPHLTHGVKGSPEASSNNVITFTVRWVILVDVKSLIKANINGEMIEWKTSALQPVPSSAISFCWSIKWQTYNFHRIYKQDVNANGWSYQAAYLSILLHPPAHARMTAEEPQMLMLFYFSCDFVWTQAKL